MAQPGPPRDGDTEWDHPRSTPHTAGVPNPRALPAPTPGALAVPRLIKPQRDRINAAALPDHAVIRRGTSLILARGLCPGTPSLHRAGTRPVLPPLSAPNSCAVMHCFPSSNKLHQKKETGLLFFFFFLARRAPRQALGAKGSYPRNASGAGRRFQIVNNGWRRCPSSSPGFTVSPAASRKGAGRPGEPAWGRIQLPEEDLASSHGRR